MASTKTKAGHFVLPDAPIRLWKKLLDRMRCQTCRCFLADTPSGYMACYRSLEHGKLIPRQALMFELGAMAREAGARNTTLGTYLRVRKRIREMENEVQACR